MRKTKRSKQAAGWVDRDSVRIDQSSPESRPAGNSRDQHVQRAPLARMKLDSPAGAVNALHAPENFWHGDDPVRMRVSVALRHDKTSPTPGEPFNLPMDENSLLAAEKHDVSATNFFWRNFTENGDVPRAHPWQHAATLHAQTNPAALLQRFSDSCCVSGAPLTAELPGDLPALGVPLPHGWNSTLFMAITVPSRETFTVHCPVNSRCVMYVPATGIAPPTVGDPSTPSVTPNPCDIL